MSKLIVSAAAAALLAMTAPSAFAAATGHGSDQGHGGDHHSSEAGEPGKASDVTTTIEVVMYDNYYEPESISVKEGETVRFIVKNAGELVHEFNIGTAQMLIDHAPEMEMMVEHGVLEADKINHDVAKQMQDSMGHGMHEMANAALLEPGKTGELIWKFPKHAEIEFGCTVPGHYDAGMVGEFSLTH